MHNPSHPGLAIRHDCLEPFELSVTAAAEVLGVTRQALSNVINGRLLVADRNPGYGYKWPMICGRPTGMPAS
jgi:plasmid maintenance system antidote protein VapI